MHFNIINDFGNVRIVKDRYTDTFDVLVCYKDLKNIFRCVKSYKYYKSAYKFAQTLLNKGVY